MFAFLALLFVLIVIYFFTSASVTTAEGFNNKVNIPVNIIPPAIPPPPATNVDESNAQPHDMPGQLPIAAYEQIAASSPLPYQDTSLIKANRQQIVSMLEMVKGFLAFEAQEISERSDPTIQLPLNTVRSDFHTLQAEVDVLNRNPGLQPTITQSHLNEIASNLAYLQREVRLIGAAGPLRGPINEFTQPIRKVEGFTSENSNNSSIASPKDIEDFIARITGEILRLSASGTTDPNTKARVVALTDLKSNVQTVLDQVKGGALMSNEIPIMKKDIDNAFPVLGKLDQPLPQIIKTMGLPPGLANMLPSNLQNDPDTRREINKLVDKYADTIVNGVSASFAVKYTSPREAEKARALASTIEKTGFPSVADLDNACNTKFTPDGGDKQVTDKLAPKPNDAGRGPSKFDWKQRAKDIEEQVRKRGLKSSDFGIMPSNTKTSQDFSWKGYTRMICSRLQATMDPSLPETCGCPPMDWQGWRIAK